MSKTVKLLTGLSRGNMKCVAQQVVDLPDGLAARLIERGQAEDTNEKPDTVKKAVAAAIKKGGKAKPKPKAKPADAGANDTHDAGTNDAPDAGANDAPDAGTNDAPDAGTNDAPDAGTNDAPDAGANDAPDAGASKE